MIKGTTTESKRSTAEILKKLARKKSLMHSRSCSMNIARKGKSNWNKKPRK